MLSRTSPPPPPPPLHDTQWKCIGNLPPLPLGAYVIEGPNDDTIYRLNINIYTLFCDVDLW